MPFASGPELAKAPGGDPEQLPKDAPSTHDKIPPHIVVHSIIVSGRSRGKSSQGQATVRLKSTDVTGTFVRSLGNINPVPDTKAKPSTSVLPNERICKDDAPGAAPQPNIGRGVAPSHSTKDPCLSELERDKMARQRVVGASMAGTTTINRNRPAMAGTATINRNRPVTRSHAAQHGLDVGVFGSVSQIERRARRRGNTAMLTERQQPQAHSSSPLENTRRWVLAKLREVQAAALATIERVGRFRCLAVISLVLYAIWLFSDIR